MATEARKPIQQGSRNAKWKRIWELKGSSPAKCLHHVDGFDLMSTEEWETMVSKISKPLRLQAGQQVIECGCGAGAFLSSLVRLYPGIIVSGVDYSPSMVKQASTKLNGRFVVGDIRDVRFLPEAAYDCVLSFSAFQYLDSAKDAKRAAREMVRLVKPGGVLMIGEVNDLAKKSLALKIRKASHKDQPKLSDEQLDHLYLPKDLFKELSSEMGLAITFKDHSQFKLPTYQAARYRYTVYYWKN